MEKNDCIPMESATVETLTPYSAFEPDARPLAENEHYGIISFCNQIYGFINDSFADPKNFPEITSRNANTTFFDLSKVTILPEGHRLDTFRFIYLVRFSTNGTVFDKQKEIFQPAIDYRVPITILHFFPKDPDSVYLIQPDGLISRKSTFPAAQQKLEQLERLLEQKIKKPKFVLASDFRFLTREAGIDDFKRYAENVGIFLKKFLPKFELISNQSIGGKRYPGLIVYTGSWPEVEAYYSSQKPTPAPKPQPEPPKEKADLSVLEKLYASGDFLGFLRSPAFMETAFCDFSQEYQEMALTCAARLLHPEDSSTVSLDLLQKELIRYTIFCDDFLKKWKKDSEYDPVIIRSCARTSWMEYAIPENTGTVVTCLNSLGSTNSVNSNYAGLSQRFALCQNKLIPNLYLLRVAAAQSTTTTVRCIVEYCRLIKEMQQWHFYMHLPSEKKLLYFSEWLRAVFQLFPELELPRTTIYNISSIYIDSLRFEELDSLLPLIDPKNISRMTSLLAYEQDPAKGLQLDIRSLSLATINLRLYQKTVALVWKHFQQDDILPDYFLFTLAQIAAYDTNHSLDEIIRYHIEFNCPRYQVHAQLLRSFGHICSLIEQDPVFYALASYLVHALEKDDSDTALYSAFQEQTIQLAPIGEKLSEGIVHDLAQQQPDSPYEICDRFAAFQFDFERMEQIQTAYTAWYLQNCMPEEPSLEAYQERLDALYLARAYDAFIHLFLKSQHFFLDADSRKSYLEKIIQSYLRLHHFSEAVSFLQTCNAPDDAWKDRQLICVLGENFRAHSLSAQAFHIFSASFSIEQAESLLLNHLSDPSTNVFAANSLLAIYCHQELFCQAAYLYTIYRPLSETGYSTLYANLRQTLPSNATNRKTPYDVIQWSFSVLNADDLIQFMLWVHRLVIPNFETVKKQHPLSFYYDHLLADPLNPTPWTRFQTFLKTTLDRQTVLDRNSWLLVVCERVLKESFRQETTDDTPRAIYKLLTDLDSKKLPLNLLAYVLPYLVESQDKRLCALLTRAFENDAVLEQLFAQNPWRSTYLPQFRSYQTFALEQLRISGIGDYSKLLNVLPTELNIDDLKILAGSDFTSPRVIAQLCSNYLQNNQIHETWEYLNGLDRTKMNYPERQLLELFILLFDDDEMMLMQDPELFHPEEEVRRVKMNCALILKTYPDKRGLKEFESNCLSLAHRMKVYSFVFRAFYDDDIYHDPAYRLENIPLEDPQTEAAYLAFLKTCYLAQLYWNASYNSFYKTWRYQKLYLCAVLSSFPQPVDDAFIRSAMEEFHHFESTYADIYHPFTEDVMAFMNSVQLELPVKRALLFALASGNVKWFLAQNRDAFCSLSQDDKNILRRIIARLDYREVSQAVYSLYSEQISLGLFEQILETADALSEMLKESLEGLKNINFDKNHLSNIFLRPATREKPSLCVDDLLRQENAVFERYSACLIPLMFARQFPFRIYGSCRYRVLRKRSYPAYTEKILRKLELCAEYFEQRGDRSVRAAFQYLSAFLCCLRGDKKNAQRSLESWQIEKSLPQEWDEEAERMRQYLSGQVEVFTPLMILDDSQTQSDRNAEDTFISVLNDHLNIPEEPLTEEAAEEFLSAYSDESLPFVTRFRSGVTLLSHYPELQKRNTIGLPAREDLTFMVGFNALQPESELSAEEQLSIALELFQNHSAHLHRSSAAVRTLQDSIIKLLGRDLSLTSWVTHADNIKNIIEPPPESGDFSALNKEILQPCKALLEPDCSNERRRAGYEEILETLKRFRNSYTAKVEASIQKELNRIDKNLQLSIRILQNADGEFVSTDGYVYYQIENTGHITADLTPDSREPITLWVQQDNLREQKASLEERPEAITSLQHGYITGGRIRLDLTGSPSSVQMTLRLIANKTVLSDTSESIAVRLNTAAFSVESGHHYITDYAVSDPRMLFGRKLLKDNLLHQLSSGLAVVYGPSRIGKTSLLSVVDQCAEAKGNVLRILYGDESSGKFSDYRDRFCKGNDLAACYDDNQHVSEYLLVQSITAALESETDRLNQIPSEELSQKLLSCLKNTNKSISARYNEVNAILKNAEMELWLVLDEFQQVVESWKSISSSCEFADICRFLGFYSRKHIGQTPQIKLLICGSDDLLRHMVIEDQSVWRQIFNDRCRIPVKPLEEEDFCRMMEEDDGISGSGIRYAPAALHTLFTYTGGVAIYGKEIGNVLLAKIQNDPQHYQHRDTLYVSDIASAAQELLRSQTSQLDSGTTEGIREIYDAVTKNLDPETDMQYLWYIACWLKEHPDHDTFPESVFTSRPLVCSETDLKNSLKVACERRIIRYEEPELGKEKFYSFCTIFYYYAVLGTSRDKLDLNKIFLSEEDTPSPISTSDQEEVQRMFQNLSPDDLISLIVGMPFEKFQQMFRNMSTENQLSLIGIMSMNKDPSVGNAIRQLAGDSVTNNTHVTVNVQKITNILNQFQSLDPGSEKYLTGLQELPRLPDYFQDTERKQLENLNSTDEALAAEAEQAVETATTRMVADYLSALVTQEDVTQTFCVWKQLGFDDPAAYEYLSSRLEPTFFSDLLLAAKLDHIFALSSHGDDSGLDYSPVTLMYCKALEKILKYHHTDFYISHFQNIRTNVKQITFGQMANMRPDTKAKIQNHILMGAFLYPIRPGFEHEWKKITSDPDAQAWWQEHGVILEKITNIRNDSAHGVEGVVVRKEQLESLKDLLFKRNNILKTNELQNILRLKQI